MKWKKFLIRFYEIEITTNLIRFRLKISGFYKKNGFHPL